MKDQKNLTVATFGEIMLRLSTNNFERILQSDQFSGSFAGAEANVSVNLKYWGENTKFLTVLPNNDLGNKCIHDLNKYAVNTSHINREDGRMGIMFLEKGASQRGSKVIYDRENSSIAKTELGLQYFERAFSDCDWFHTTGITPALSLVSLKNTKTALQTANELGLAISIDLNYRNKLWNYGKEATEVMPGLAEYANIIVGNEEDALMSLGIKNSTINVTKGDLPLEAYKDIAEQIFNKYKKCEVIAFSLRDSINATINNWSGIMFTQDKVYTTQKYHITNIVDRVGAGDTFASGLIYGLRNFEDNQKALDFAVAASCLKHTIEGDYCLANVNEIVSLTEGNSSGRITR